MQITCSFKDWRIRADVRRPRAHRQAHAVRSGKEQDGKTRPRGHEAIAQVPIDLLCKIWDIYLYTCPIHHVQLYIRRV